MLGKWRIQKQTFARKVKLTMRIGRAMYTFYFDTPNGDLEYFTEDNVPHMHIGMKIVRKQNNKTKLLLQIKEIEFISSADSNSFYEIRCDVLTF